jgi:competence protein ComEC
LLIAILVSTWPDGKIRVVFCDVGQGDATLISKGNTQILVDGGPYSWDFEEYEGVGELEEEVRRMVFSRKESPVLDCLSSNMPFWDRKIEMVMATHPDLDHIGGLVSVLERFEVGKFFGNGGEGESLAWKEVERRLEEEGVESGVLARGNKVMWGEMILEVLSPEKGLGFEEANEGSLVMLLGVEGKKILLMGDATVEVERRLVWRKILDEKVDILKAGHHGSKTSTSDELLDRVSPEVVIFSVGEGNSYGHPAEEVLERVVERGIEIRRTDEEGQIEYLVD